MVCESYKVGPGNGKLGSMCCKNPPVTTARITTAATQFFFFCVGVLGGGSSYLMGLQRRQESGLSTYLQSTNN